jgi:uncharacterized protein YqgV (UPF0045/DUF77 family)
MKNNIHLSIQIVPLQITDQRHPYAIIDKAIEVIDQSGLSYQVSAMETVIEGSYDKVMDVAKKALQICFEEGANELVVNMKLHIRKDGDITFHEKMEKYS